MSDTEIITIRDNVFHVVTEGVQGPRGVDGIGIAADPTTKLFPISDGFLFDTAPAGTPAGTPGEMYWNADDKTLNLVTGTGAVIQIGQEMFGIGVNKTGALVPDGKVVYSSGVLGNRMTIDYADSRELAKCSMVGVVTADIADNAEGAVTTFGVVRGYDTSAWAPGTKLYVAADASGDLTATQPANGYHLIWVATTLNQTSNGSIFVNPVHDIHEEYDPYSGGWDYAGILSRDESTISFVDGTRTFSITPVSSTFSVYFGAGVVDMAADSVVIPDTVGLHFIYFDSADQDLKSSTSEWEISGLSVPVSMVYWDGASGWLMEERHGIRNAAARELHEMLHQTVGARYASGFAGTFDNTTLSVATGEFYDDNLEHVITTKTVCRLLYRNASNQMQDTPNTTTPYAVNAGTIQYDNAGTLTNVTSNRFVTNWVYITNDADYPVYVVVGQEQHTNISDARAAAAPTIPNIPVREWKLLYAVIYKNAGGTPTYQEKIDYRTASSIPGGGVESLPASSVVFTPAAGILATNVQAALEEVSGYEVEAITGTSTCVIDLDGRRFGNYSFTVTENVTLSITNPPASGAWGIVLELTNGGAYTVSYTSDWKEEGGTALSFTAAGMDRVVITGQGSTATTVVINVAQADVK